MKVDKNKLLLSSFKLKTLKDITIAINNNTPKEELLLSFCRILKDKLNIGKILLYLKTTTGWEIAIQENISREDVERINPDIDFPEEKDILIINPERNLTLAPFDLLIPVYHKNIHMAYLLVGDIDPHMLGISPSIKHFSFIQTLINIIVVAIENKKLHKEFLEKAATQKELEVASMLQKKLIPTNFPDNEYFEIDAIYMPHKQVGGDYYDYFQLKNNEYLFCIADVSGKGIPAALLMSNFQAAIKVMIQYTTDLREMVRKLNALVYENTQGEKFITLFLCKFCRNNNMLEYINCAHFPPIFINNHEIHYLSTGSVMIGAFAEIREIEVGQILTSPRSILVAYTDGICEQQNEKNEQYGIERIASLAFQHQEKSIRDIIAIIREDVLRFKGREESSDDITLVGIKRKY